MKWGLYNEMGGKNRHKKKDCCSQSFIFIGGYPIDSAVIFC